MLGKGLFHIVTGTSGSGGNGSTVYVGLTEPSSSLGKEGDVYFDTHKGEFYEKIDNTIWVMRMEFALKKDIVGGTNDYNDLINTPEIPAKVSELENDAGYITESKGFSYHRGYGFDPPEEFGDKGDIFYRNDTGEILEKTDLGWSTLVRYATHEALKQKTAESAYDIAVRHGFVGTEVDG